MHDLGANWPAMPDWQEAVLHSNGILVKTLTGLQQYLISGTLEQFAAIHGKLNIDAGALALVSGDRYALRLARDRMLFIADGNASLEQGWNKADYAVTEISAALHIFEIEGSGVADLLSEALLIDPDNAGASANVQFAGQMAVLYRYEQPNRLRLHIDRGLALYLWSWLEARQ